MPRNTQLDAIINTGAMGKAYRVLTTDLQWPSGDPPYQPGADGRIPSVSVPALPTSPARYTMAGFDASVWTDCTALVSEYHYTQDTNMPIDQLSLSVPADWRKTDLNRVFREMRVIVVQERYSARNAQGQLLDSGWLNLCWCISDGYTEKWENGTHWYIVEAKSVLKLANLEILGAETGTVVYQADTVSYGTVTAQYQLTYLRDAGDAYEYGITLTPGDASTPVQPNWADAPAPRCWCTNTRKYDDTLESEPIPLTGDAVNVTFGEGILRLGKSYAHADNANNGATDYTAGLNIPAGETPVVVGVVSRFAHPASTEGWPRPSGALPVPSDVVDGLVVTAAADGQLTVNAAFSAGIPENLTLLLRDGSGRRIRTSGYTVTGTTTVLTIPTGIPVAVGTPLTYGDANRVRDVVTRILLTAGYQTHDATAPLYLYPVPEPALPAELQGGELVLPPVVMQESDGYTPLAWCERLRSEGLVPPNYLVRDDAQGRVRVQSVVQRYTGEEIIPLTVLPATPGLEHERTDIAVYSRVVIRGQARLAEDLIQRADFTISEPEEAAGGIPSVATANAIHTLSGFHSRESTPPSGGYYFPLSNLVTTQQATIKGQLLRPWGWYVHPQDYPWGDEAKMDALVKLWQGRTLCLCQWATPVDIDTLELQMPNTWLVDTSDWGGNRHKDRSGIPRQNQAQELSLWYHDLNDGTWQPLLYDVTGPIVSPSTQTITSEQFSTRAAIRTDSLQLRCEQPTVVSCMTASEEYYHFVIGVWLFRLRIWASSALRGVAELGNAANYGGAFVADPWPAIRQRLRRRTYELPETIPWVQDQETANWLATEHLRQCVLDLAPRKLAAIRPDVWVHDTVSFTTPTGETSTYLVQTTDHTNAAPCAITAADENHPYFDEEA